MHMPLNQFSPDVKLGFVSASRDCFPRELSVKRSRKVRQAAKKAGLELVTPNGRAQVIESKKDAVSAAHQLHAEGADAAVLYLGNFSPEIEDACFVKEFPGTVMLLAAAEESTDSLAQDRGDALCGLLSATMAVSKRDLLQRVYIPEVPVVDVDAAVDALQDFVKIVKIVKGAQNATLGLFGPRPRDFETCNYNISSLLSIGMEVEEFGFFDLQNKVEELKKGKKLSKIIASMKREMKGIPQGKFVDRLAAYEKAVLDLRDEHKLSGMTSQCWAEQEFALGHVPCYINARMAARGFPVACENDAYSLASELLAQYASDASVTVLDINHSIPADMAEQVNGIPAGDLVGLFHCGNTAPCRLQDAEMKHQAIMKRVMEPESEPDISRGTIEGMISASPITVMQVHGVGDRLRAYICEGHFLELDPNTFGCVGTAYLPDFQRFYRHVLLGRFHHHAAVAFAHCGAVLVDALQRLGVSEIHTPLPECVPYPGENTFRTGLQPINIADWDPETTNLDEDDLGIPF